VAIAAADAGELTAALFGAFEAEKLAWVAPATPPAVDLLRAFSPELVIGDAGDSGLASVSLSDLLGAEPPADAAKVRPDYKTPVIAHAKPGGGGEVLHNQKTLAAMAIAIGSFYMMDAETTVVLYEPPSGWLSLALLLGTIYKGGCVYAAWERDAARLPERVDYVVAGWDEAVRRFLGAPAGERGPRIGAGAIVGVEEAFSLSRRRRLTRRFGAPVLTLLGRNDLGPVMGSHPSWFLDDAMGIPLPNVDTRPMNPKDGTPLNIGWDAVEVAELGVKSAFTPAGGTAVDGWCRSELLASVDPTGLYFLERAREHIKRVR
jgi:hypothetical protein